MELSIYLYYFKQLVRMQTLSMNKTRIDDEVIAAFFENYIMPDRVMYHDKECIFYYGNNDSNHICVKVPYFDEHKERRLNYRSYIIYEDYYMIIPLYRYVNSSDINDINKILDQLKTIEIPLLGDMYNDILDKLGRFYDNMLPFLCDNLKDQFAGYIFSTGIGFKGGEKNGT
ncbi:MAG TPA: hypothetical protein VK190_02495 [Pseudoneobacillus sp.]|nr:hypothetical protein [Pseudoneobacillus sp.]